MLWFVLTSYFPCKIVFLSYATLIAVCAYAYVAYFYSVAPLFIFKSSVVKFCLFCHYDAMPLHHCAYVRVHSCCLYFFTQYNVKLSHRGACVSVDLSNFGSSFTHYTAMHHCGYESIGLSSSISYNCSGLARQVSGFSTVSVSA